MSDNITIKGARVNNLKDINVDIPRGKFVVVTGVSGSGKSSLAFDTLFAEGQRRYVESLSSYARQFLGRLSKPEVDEIKGLPPAIAVEQKVKSSNPRSTVGTSTEIYDYLRMLFARIGETVSPVSGEVVRKHQPKDVLDYIDSLPEGSKAVLLAPVSDRSVLLNLKSQGFSRVLADGKFYRIDEFCEENSSAENVKLVIERFTVEHDQAFRNRMADSVETAFYEGGGICYVDNREFSSNFEADGIVFQEPTDQLFSFNSPLGACPVCQGFGNVIGIDEDLVVPDRSRSLYDEAIACWRGEKMSWYRDQIIRYASHYGIPVHKPYFELSDSQKEYIWEGTPDFEGVRQFFQMVEQNQYKIQYRVMLARYRGKTTCPECHGARLRKEALYVKVNGHTIADLTAMPVSELKNFFDTIELSQTDADIARQLLTEIRNRLQYLCDVGLEYLTLNRLSNTLSGGESQRINLARSLGSSLMGSLYILDEPSIGLHPRNTDMLISVLRHLQQLGNTVVVVEHDEAIMRAADYIIDIGPKAGRHGGEVMAAGSPAELLANVDENTESVTLRYLKGWDMLPVPASRRRWNNYIEVIGATENNLRNVNVRFPLNVMTVVTGVSGSGKSTLVRDIFYAGMRREAGEAVDRIGSFSELRGSLKLVTGIEFVDQSSIGTSSRSNPCTYLKAFDEVRKLFAEQGLARHYGYKSSFFSFNSPGGRCEACKGDGRIKVEMQFMADVELECEECHGTRYKSDALDVKYRGVDIHDVLEMTVNQAIEFFSQDDNTTARKIVKRLQPLQDVGLGYVKLGQSSSTLSGGESQRVKLASFLAGDETTGRIYLFDEPTTGLHYADIRSLLESFNRLIAKGNTVIIIEHNLDVIRHADHIIDMGPEGGKRGGTVVFTGTPEEIVNCADSITGRYLRQ